MTNTPGPVTLTTRLAPTGTPQQLHTPRREQGIPEATELATEMLQMLPLRALSHRQLQAQTTLEPDHPKSFQPLPSTAQAWRNMCRDARDPV